jgi:hypothetical protein
MLMFLGITVILNLHGQAGGYETPGDRAIAETYVIWAETAIAENRWAEALAGLERGADFSAVSSDLAYLLALARSHENQPKGAVLEALHYGLEINRWNRYSAGASMVLKAETMLHIRRYNDALSTVAGLPQTQDIVCLKLRALKGLDDRAGFSKLLAEGMNAYPREPRLIRIFFEYAAERLPEGNERDLLDRALKRLPLLIQSDKALAYLAVPFIFDNDNARRLLAAYRAETAGGVPASIPRALNLGLIEGNDGVEELFKSPLQEEKRLDKNLLLEVWSLLRDTAQRDHFTERLAAFSGLITEDADKDGYPESYVRYQDGIITEYWYDENQDGLAETTVFFEAGVPVRMEAVLPSDSEGAGRALYAYPPATDKERIKAEVRWEQYPSVLNTSLQGAVYIPKPFDFFFFPLYFKRLECGGLLYPERNDLMGKISQRGLVFSSLAVERPSREFPGGVERIDLEQGIPQKAQERLYGRLVSETTFQFGRPAVQRIDLDRNGYLETLRYFQKPEPQRLYAPGYTDYDFMDFTALIEFSESDWDGDGVFEYGERYIYAGEDSKSPCAIERFWDMDRDGVREFADQAGYVKN